LQEREQGLPALVEHLRRRQMHELNRRFEKPPAIVVVMLQRHNWPGNIRELNSVIERACIRSRGQQSRGATAGFVAEHFALSDAPARNSNGRIP
jgi:DNA-binding NtrC family response regulator